MCTIYPCSGAQYFASLPYNYVEPSDSKLMFVIYLYIFNLGNVIDCRPAGTPCSRWILFLTNCLMKGSLELSLMKLMCKVVFFYCYNHEIYIYIYIYIFYFFFVEFIADSTNRLRLMWRPICHFLPLPFVFSVQSILELNVAVAGMSLYCSTNLLFDIHTYQCHLCNVNNAIIYMWYTLCVMCGPQEDQLIALASTNVRCCHPVLQEGKMPECSQICLRAPLLTVNTEFIRTTTA